MIRRLLRPFVRAHTYRAFLFYAGQLALAVAGFVVIVAGWLITALLAITPLVVPLLIGLRYAVWALALGEAALGRTLLGRDLKPGAPPVGSGFWDRGFRVLRDQAFWKQQTHLLLNLPIGLALLCVFSWAFELATLPIWYRWVASDDVLGFANVDSFGEALPFGALGLVLLLAAAHILVPLTGVSRRLESALLADDGRRMPRTAAERRANWIRALSIQALASTTIVVALVVVWALTTGGYFWPIWPMLALATALAIPGWVFLVLEYPALVRLAVGSRALAIQIGVSAILLGYLVAVWAVTTRGYFWPAWVALGLAVLALVHAAVAYGRRQHRIERLESSRAGAVDVQEAELRRIERDLHDGAQARLVALGISLGLAEQKLETDPEAVRELLVEARRGAGEALEELRDLARGIRPPILTDRGLEPAIAALTSRSPVPVTLTVDARGRYPSAVETAAYFTVAESVANAIKHGRAKRIEIRIGARDGVLVAEVVDDGAGGANESGPGLTGLRQRAEALDGRLSVKSPDGGPTTVRAELPCES
jgi:signal transduction histidine kinase